MEGAVTIAADGTILYCNQLFADLIGTTLHYVLGVSFRLFIAKALSVMLSPVAVGRKYRCG